MKRLFLISSIIFLSVQVWGQSPDYRTNSFGSLIDWSFLIGPSEGEGADILYGNSSNFTYGFVYIRNFHSVVGAGVVPKYQFQSIHMDQIDGKLVPNTIMHDREIFKLHNFGTELFLRFTFAREITKPLVYMDLGGYFNWAFGANHETFNEVEDMGTIPNGFTEVTNTYSGLNYFETFNYGLSAKIGYKSFALTGSYRFSDYLTQDFKDQVADAEFPRITIGVQFNPMR